ncbi:hypothetical protein LJR231_001531 [Phyllobacterium sp. LjRoot231]|uniref:hypothetical protein n=1 Tax=Phyllobacterium sp. LjRoot231 TaxID=3342289 RepID=UPI003ED14908
MTELTAEQIACLKEAPFTGFAAGSNMWPLVHLAPSNNHVCDGEDCDLLLRRGLLMAVPLAVTVPSDRGDGRDIPDVDLTHQIHLTALGKAELAKHLASKESPA